MEGVRACQPNIAKGLQVWDDLVQGQVQIMWVIGILFSFSLHVMVVYYIIYLPGVIIIFINFLYFIGLAI